MVDFYDRRIRRIFPALFAVLLASALCAVWLLFPEELKNFGASFFASSLFYANYYFMQDTGYFAAPAESKPLLHLWSLAIEEQYYVLFPLYLYAVWRWCRRGLFALTLALSVCSFGYSIWLMGHAPDAAFYSAPARAWELMVGAMLAMLIRSTPIDSVAGPRVAGTLATLGLAMILIPVQAYTEATPFPGATAALPVLGAAAVLYATQRQHHWVTRLLSSPPLRFVGLISYSLYLWHWPVFVFYKTYFIEPLTLVQTAGMLALVFLLAIVSWRFIESPFRAAGKRSTGRRVVTVGLVVMVAGVACGAMLKSGDGLPDRFSDEVRRTLDARDDTYSAADCRPQASESPPGLGLCALGADGDLAQASFAVWGDSHAEALLPAVAEAARKAGVSGIAFVRGGCPALLGVDQARDGYRDCDEKAEAFMAFLKQNPQLKQVIVASRWALYAMGVRFLSEPGTTVFITDSETLRPSIEANRPVFERGLVRTIDRLAGMGRDVAFVSQVPEAEYRIPLAMARAQHLHRDVSFAPSLASYRTRQAVVDDLFARHLTPLAEGASPAARISIVRPENMLCDAGICAVTAGGLPIYRDSTHLTRTQALAMSGLFEPLMAASAARRDSVDAERRPRD